MSDEPFWPPENYYRVSLKALIFDSKGRLLIGKDGSGECSMPGGGWDHGEDYAACIKREVAEEFGAKVVGIGPAAFFYRCEARDGQPKVSIALPVTLQDFDFSLSPDDDEVKEAHFVTKAEFLDLTFQSGEAPVQKYAGEIWRLVEKTGRNR